MINEINETQAMNVFVVLGMGRSGTSVIARALNVLGVDLGNNLHQADQRNPKGFFEDLDILYKVNRGVMNELDCTLMEDNPFHDRLSEHHDELRHFKNYAIQLLRERFAKTEYWGFKDPSTVLLLPFWQSVFRSLNADDRYVIALRNPMASVYSNQEFNHGGDLEVQMLFWLYKLISAVDGTMGKKRVVVCYELMMMDPVKQLGRMHDSLDIPFELDAEKVDAYANDFLDKKLLHYDFTDDDFKKNRLVAIAPLCLKVYDILMRVAKDELEFDSYEFEIAWQSIKEEYARMQPIYHYIGVLLKRNKEYEREIRYTGRSIFWKLLYPVRLLEDVYRMRRRLARNRKRLPDPA